jgi:hypothetical protein
MVNARAQLTYSAFASLLWLCSCLDDDNRACEDMACDSTSVVHSSTSSDDPASSTTASWSSATSSGSSDSFSIDVFGEVGNVYEFSVSSEQAQKMEETVENSEDQYPPPGGGTFADALVVRARNGTSRHYGKTGLRIIGQSSRRDWDHIPSLKLDVDKFVPSAPKIGAWERLRMHNGQVGGIFREAVALRVWRALGYPTPLTNFVWVRSSVWGDGIGVPYTLVENYKRDWCERTLPNGCLNMWEGAGDIGSLNSMCQLSSCDNARLESLQAAMNEAMPGPGYRAALESFIDWPAFEKFQCLSWMTATGDDYIHNLNNTVLVERPDGKFQLLPYSTDISAGQSWYPSVGLPGISALAIGCQADPLCWSKLLTTCATLVDQFDELKTASSILAPIYAELNAQGMLRERDEERFAELSQWYEERPKQLRDDAIWTATPCQDDSQCVAAPNGASKCHPEQHICVEPCHASDAECPEGQICDDFSDICVVGERYDELGDRFSPSALLLPVEMIISLTPGDEDCVLVDVDPESPGLLVETSGPGCLPEEGQRTTLILFDDQVREIARAESPDVGDVCASLDLELEAKSYIACVQSSDDRALNGIAFRVQTSGVEVEGKIRRSWPHGQIELPN